MTDDSRPTAPDDPNDTIDGDKSKQCSDYIIALQKELTAVQADVERANQTRRKGQCRLETLRGEQRRLQHRLMQVQTRRHERGIAPQEQEREQRTEPVAQKQTKQLAHNQQRQRPEKQNETAANRGSTRTTTTTTTASTTTGTSISSGRNSNRNRDDEASQQMTERLNTSSGVAVSFETEAPTTPVSLLLSSGSSPRRRERRMDIV